MAIIFNTLLREAGLALDEVRLVRHKDNSSARGRTPYELWRDDRPKFEIYQSHQVINNRKKFTVPYWAVFIINLQGDTMFAGLYSVKYGGLLDHDCPMPHRDGIDKAGTCDHYDLTLQDTLSDLIGKLFIDWGKGVRAWVQHADWQEKPITELRPEFKEPAFPGFLNFIKPLSELARLPKNWTAALQSSRGVYLLTCPRTNEQYVGSASGENGFWGRWQNYIQTGDGGNSCLMNRDPSDYQFSILEVAGSSATTADIQWMEGLWQDKLQSQLNGNLAMRV